MSWATGDFVWKLKAQWRGKLMQHISFLVDTISSKFGKKGLSVPQSGVSATNLHLKERISMKVASRSDIGRQLLDEGIFEVMERTPKEGIPSLMKAVVNQYTQPRDRHEANISLSLILKLRDVLPTICENCLYLKERCVCPYIMPVNARHELRVFQTVGEYARRNNSATLLGVVTNAECTLRGIQKEENELLQFISKNQSSTAILFPSASAMEMDKYAQNVGAADNIRPQTLILLDGTWGDAANMNSFLPQNIPRIKLSEESRRTWLYPMRGQSRSDRVCTAQGKDPLYINNVHMNVITPYHDLF